MEVNWMVIGLVVLCGIILVVYLIKQNLEDKEDVTKFLNEQVFTKKKFESDNDDEL
jgi:hypothetical protein